MVRHAWRAHEQQGRLAFACGSCWHAQHPGEEPPQVEVSLAISPPCTEPLHRAALSTAPTSAGQLCDTPRLGGLISPPPPFPRTALPAAEGWQTRPAPWVNEKAPSHGLHARTAQRCAALRTTGLTVPKCCSALPAALPPRCGTSAFPARCRHQADSPAEHTAPPRGAEHLQTAPTCSRPTALLRATDGNAALWGTSDCY